MITRILLLFLLTWLMSLSKPFFAVLDHGISGKDLILIAGGLFLLAKSTLEIHEKLEGAVAHERLCAVVYGARPQYAAFTLAPDNGGSDGFYVAIGAVGPAGPAGPQGIGVNLGLFPHVDLDLDLDVDLVCDRNALTLGASELFGHGRVSRWRTVGHSDYRCQEANYSLINIVFAKVQVCNDSPGPRPNPRPGPRGSRGLRKSGDRLRNSRIALRTASSMSARSGVA